MRLIIFPAIALASKLTLRAEVETGGDCNIENTGDKLTSSCGIEMPGLASPSLLEARLTNIENLLHSAQGVICPVVLDAGAHNGK